MGRRPPRSTRTATPFPTRRSSDLPPSYFPARAPEAGSPEIQFRAAQDRTQDPNREIGRALDGSRQGRRFKAAWFVPAETPISDRRRACRPWSRSEEHTSELQSLMRISYAVFCLKKKKQEPA